MWEWCNLVYSRRDSLVGLLVSCYLECDCCERRDLDFALPTDFDPPDPTATLVIRIASWTLLIDHQRRNLILVAKRKCLHHAIGTLFVAIAKAGTTNLADVGRIHVVNVCLPGESSS